MLPTGSRLHTAADFAAVLRHGRRAGAGTLVVHLWNRAPGGVPTGTARAGFVVSRKTGNSVVRHRITRRLRPLVRRHLTHLPSGVDLVVRALPAAANASSADLGHDLDAALRTAARRAGTPVGHGTRP
ncbi:ribonuclease P protein component [Nakamurella endophytica]|uniref:Ribonuclease P protein component n=1 Tax=Nakamurella endophytica TaxID=1748367 RepID=A0A917WEJ6_9ACTN|nr:ribonuclease P protein component [Nakamurella endophytica]GGL97371.1 ribonuclease P protein component [Nakamurella endophytica]